MPRHEGWDSDLSFHTPTSHPDALPRAQRVETQEDFWDLILVQLSHGHLDDCYPFNWEASEELKANEPKSDYLD